MAKEYVNKALEELLEPKGVEVQSMIDWRTVKTLHCSQFQAFSYLRNLGFHGISNNRQMNQLFRFAIASYDNGCFSGVGIVFLDVVVKNCCFIVIKANQVGDGVAILDKLEQLCKIANVDELKITNGRFIEKVIFEIEKDRGINDRYERGRGCYRKRISRNDNN